MDSPLMKVYGCGGCGINLTSQMQVPVLDGYTAVEKVLIDTSESNVKDNKDIPFFHVPGMNGAGKNRMVAHKGAVDQVNAMLQEHKPGTINIVLFSLSGGSGSVLGPLIAAELVKRGAQTICMVVGSITSAKEAANSRSTLLTLESLATKVVKKPITVAYFENTVKDDNPQGSNLGVRTTVDAKLLDSVDKLAMLSSERNDEFDREDLGNMLDYTRVTQVPPQLVDLIITGKPDRLSSLTGKAISVASLLTGRDVQTPDLSQLYSAVGYYPSFVLEKTEAAAGHKLPELSFVISHVMRTPRTAHFDSVISDYKKTEEALVEEAATEVESTDDGFVFD